MKEKTLPSSGGYFNKEMIEILEAGEKEEKKNKEDSSKKENDKN